MIPGFSFDKQTLGCASALTQAISVCLDPESARSVSVIWVPISFAIGLIFMAISFMIMLAAVALAMESAPIGMRWLLLTYLLQTWGELTLSPIGLSAFSRYSPKKYVGQMFGLWFLASAIGGVLAGLLGGEALDTGLSSMSPVFTFMIKYYLGIAAVRVILAFIIGRSTKAK